MREYVALADTLGEPAADDTAVSRAEALLDEAAVALLAAQRQRALLMCAQAGVQPLLVADGDGAPGFHELSARIRHLEGEMARCDVEEKMRQTHSRRQLAEEMMAQQLETLEGRLSTLRRTQKALAHVSRLGLLAHPSFPRFVLLFAPAFGVFWLLASMPRVRARLWAGLVAALTSVR